MKPTETLDEDIAAYERKTGDAVSPELRELFAAMADAGDHFYSLGAKDAAEGYARRTIQPFIEWEKRDMGDRYDEKDNQIAILMHLYYTRGYDSLKGEEG